MSMTVVKTRWQLAIRLAFAGSAITVLAGCSQDTSRFSDPFSNPFAASTRIGGDPDLKSTGSMASAAPVGEVRSAPLPTRTGALQNEPTATSRQLVDTGASEHNEALARRLASTPGAGAWSVERGTPVVVGQSETLESLSRRYGVPSDALLNVNGLSSAAMVKPGAHIVIPTYNAQGGASPAGAKLADRQTSRNTARLTPPRPIAKPSPARGSEMAKLTPAVKPGVGAQPVLPAAALTPATGKGTVRRPDVDPTPTASLTPLPSASAPAEEKPAINPEFRWPVRGRVIQAFKSGANDGINIAVPEGTSVKAAENGTVVYAGSELKGYGNLVLIRHPNGFTTAYANNGEISVKRGDQVKRGQIIAKSGQSGNVASPQLHFELRKGSTPIDPSSYLAGL
jgi:murein DD-endopeptidase MepM/ murein hydrolase activator NlpD